MTPRAMAAIMPRGETPIVPKRSIAGRALVAVVAIMTFLASLTTGAVMLVRAPAIEWQSDVAREVTIQVRPARGRDLDAEVVRAVELARAVPGVGEVRAYTKEELARLLEPWLGSGLSLEDLPVPRMIVVKLPPAGVDFAPLKKDAGREGRRRQPRRSSRLDRPHAHHGADHDRRRHRHSHPDAGRDGAVGDLRHPRRHGDQPPDRRGAAFHRRQERFHRRPVSAPFPAARTGGRR